MSPEPASSTIPSCSDPDAFPDHDVPFHTETETVPTSVVEQVAEMDDLTPTGVTSADGSVLFARVESDCDWKIPSSAVPPEAAYDEAANEWVTDLSGLDVTLEAVEGVWRIELTAQDSDATAERHFVVFSASPTTDEPRPTVPTDAVAPADRPADIGWFDALPEGAEEPPGTDQFVE